MKKIYIYIIMIACTSCGVHKDVIGSYSKKGKDFKYNLTLNKDSTFTLTKLYFEANSNCKGKWHYYAKDVIILKCDSNKDITAALSSGYMAEKEQKVTILSGNKIKLQNQILNKSN